SLAENGFAGFGGELVAFQGHGATFQSGNHLAVAFRLDDLPGALKVFHLPGALFLLGCVPGHQQTDRHQHKDSLPHRVSPSGMLPGRFPGPLINRSSPGASTSWTFRTRASGLNGFCKKAVSASRTPWRTTASSV